MFTGLIEEVGTIQTILPRGESVLISVMADSILENMAIGDSIAISGVCQTVVKYDRSSFSVEAVRETMQRTRFGSYKPGTRVNLERAMLSGGRFGGHIVQGHVDGLIKVKEIRELQGSWRLALELPGNGRSFVVEKGSVCLDGISLTVAQADENRFEVEIIPHTWKNTTLHTLRVGETIHVEWDILAKYVANMMAIYRPENGISLEKLRSSGFGG